MFAGVVRPRPVEKGERGISSSSSSAVRAPCGLSLYADTPDEEVTLEDFEVFAFQRLKLLREIENAKSRGIKMDELCKLSLESARKHLDCDVGLTDMESYRKDVISHHILRLAFCNTEDKRRQFLSGEETLFTARLSKLSPEQLTTFTERHGLNLTPLGPDERMDIAEHLRAVWEAVDDVFNKETDGEYGPWLKLRDSRFHACEYFKVPFIQAVNLLHGRKVYLRGGSAFVPKRRCTAILINRFKVYLKMALAMANKALPAILSDERLDPILKSMANAYTGAEYGGGKKGVGGEVRADGVDELGKTAFALCMSNLQETLKGTHHLKHWGRQQYGLFLKGIGLPMEEALVFWQRHFTRKMSPDDFLKKYAYNIRHNYGKEGKRADYTAYPCTRIIMGNAPGVEDAHGCPYKHWDEARLRVVLERMRLPGDKVGDIMAAVRNKEPQVACRRQFEARYPGADSGPVGNHPNSYYDQAILFLKAKAEVGEEGVLAAAAATAAATAAAGGLLTTTTTVTSAPAVVAAGGGNAMAEE